MWLSFVRSLFFITLNIKIETFNGVILIHAKLYKADILMVEFDRAIDKLI